jgi:hypothetical protein
MHLVYLNVCKTSHHTSYFVQFLIRAPPVSVFHCLPLLKTAGVWSIFSSLPLYSCASKCSWHCSWTARPWKMGLISCADMLVTNYRFMMCKNSSGAKISFALWQTPEIMHGISKFLYSYTFWETSLLYTELCVVRVVCAAFTAMYVYIAASLWWLHVEFENHQAIFRSHIHVTDTVFKESMVTCCYSLFCLCFDTPNTHIFRQVGSRRRMSKAGSHVSATHNRHGSSVNHGVLPAAPREEAAAAMTLNSHLGPVAETSMLPRDVYCAEHIDAAFKYPHLQVRWVFFQQNCALNFHSFLCMSLYLRCGNTLEQNNKRPGWKSSFGSAKARGLLGWYDFTDLCVWGGGGKLMQTEMQLLCMQTKQLNAH